jgi:hypothetical protein
VVAMGVTSVIFKYVSFKMLKYFLKNYRLQHFTVSVTGCYAHIMLDDLKVDSAKISR